MKKLLILLTTAFLLAACGDTNDKTEDVQTGEVDQEKQENVEDTNNGEKASEPIEVTMNVETIIEDDGKVRFKGDTNLPDFAELMFTVGGVDNYSAQTKAIVSEGSFETESFSKQGEALPKGDYELSLTLSIPSTQDDKFVEVAGENYENLTGNLMKESDIGKTMEYKTAFTIEQVVEKEYISADEVQELIEYMIIGENDELLSVEVVDGEIKASIKKASNDLFPEKDIAVNSYSQISDELLNRDDWDILTIEFVGVGTISMNRSESESNEFGSYFPTLEIENKLQ